MLFICDFCKNQAQQILKVPCVVNDPEEGLLTLARILNSEAATMNICGFCLGLDTN
jgi:hypothetical protein